MLTERREAVLKAIVGDYIANVAPVGSHVIAQRQDLAVSPATIRMEMAALEEEGYIVRPHSSSGGVPSDKGYRHYVERLAEKRDLAPREKGIIRQQFARAYLDQEEWAHMAGAVLPKITGNMAVITVPKATQVRLRRLDLIPVQDLLILLILVLQETKIIRHLFPLDEAIPQQQLNVIANRLSDVFEGATSADIDMPELDLTPLEQDLMRLARDLMMAEELRNYEEPIFDGLHELFGQPEFSSAELLRDFMEVLEQRGYLRGVVEHVYSGPGVQVAIGGELPADSMRHFSLVIAEYGIAGQVTGVVGVLGPKRMNYGRNMSAVNYLAQLMSQLTEDLYL